MLESWAPALAHTAPPTVPGIARPYSRPDRPAPWLTVAARAIGTPASATRRRPLDLDSLGAILDHQAADPGVGDDHVAAPAEDGVPEARATGRTGPACAARRRCGRRRRGRPARPARSVVNRARGSSREVFTPIRRWMSVPIASGIEAPPWARSPGSSGQLAARAAEDRRRLGEGPALGRGQDQVGHGGRGRRPAEGPRGGGHRVVGGRIVEDRGGGQERVRRRTASSSIRRAAPASTSGRALACWWPAAWG